MIRALPGRLAVALILVITLLVASPALARAEPTTTQQYGVQLLGQTPWVRNSGNLTIRVGFTGADPTADRVEVSYFPQLINRTNFDSAATGRVPSYPFYTSVQPLSKLPSDPAGGSDVVVPVNISPPAGALFAVFNAPHSGVFPLQVTLVDSKGIAQGSPLTTFLVFAAGDNTPLSVSLVLPVDSPVSSTRSGDLQPPVAAQSARLASLATVLDADANVPVSVLTNPLTVASLQAGASAGSAADRTTLGKLAGAPQNGLIEVLPSTYAAVPPGDLVLAGMSSEADRQVEAGANTLRSVYGVAPTQRTWAVNGPLDASTLGFLQAHHVGSVIVPNSDLSTYDSQVTFASATWLDFAGSRMKVVAADPQLSADFDTGQPPVLAASDMLAELAMIQTEQPSNRRGVAAMPPPGWSVSPDFVATLMAGLNGNPLVKAVTASDLFNRLPPPEVTRYLSSPDPSPSRAQSALGDASSRILAARSDLGAVAAMFPDTPTLSTLSQKLLLAESETVGATTRDSILAAIESERAKVVKQVGLPGSTSITLTATKGQLPITILTSPSLHPRVELRLRSQRLIFRPASPADGKCSVPTPTNETCILYLNGQNTTLKVPVETRTSGVFPLDVELWTPDGALLLASDHDTVRSTAVSGVGVVLIVVTLLSLGIWWVRDLRHGRRPKRLVPAPDGEPDVGDERGEDRDLRDFSDNAPSDLHPGNRRSASMSPLHPTGGPSSTSIPSAGEAT